MTKSQQVLAFDVYGTLIDTQALTHELSKLCGDKATLFAKLWREKQVEYSFRRGLMQRYETFEVCTKDALNFVDQHLNCEFTEQQKSQLMKSYEALPAFDDVKESLNILQRSNYQIYAFSNGTTDAIESLLTQADLVHLFDDIISVDAVQSFKPNPAVYQHLLNTTGTKANQTWLISSNPFDVSGAISTGLKSVWLKRHAEQTFDPWEFQPTVTIETLLDLKDCFD